MLGGGAEPTEFEVPDGLDPLLTLALGMRAGYAAKPVLPLGHVVNGAAERLPREYVDYVLSIGQRPAASRLAALSTAWSQTRAALVDIGKFRPLAPSRCLRLDRRGLCAGGDVPVLAGWTLANGARAFEDIAELDFRLPEAEDPDEIDIAALVDGRVVIGEAKRIASSAREERPTVWSRS